jgi:hypothetical protein
VPRSAKIVFPTPCYDDLGDDQFEYEPDARFFRWKCRPNGRTRSVYFQLLPSTGTVVEFDLQINGERVPDKVYVGMDGHHPARLPTELTLDGPTADPVIDAPFRAPQDGFYVIRHGRPGASTSPARTGTTLDQETVRQLQSLGYLR